MNEIRLKKIVDDKNIDLKHLSNETLVHYSTLKDWYDTSQFDGDEVGIHQLTNISAALGVEITELIDLPNS
ncbi:helix-turn-helix domain-containing protein [Enterococcus faecalis]|jgi:DNA-binding Xre family transcriptional regulator|uniref:helix-turn-helix domain-containing protein n=1 Tax=Enterococcus faecalis TaxID=1351 RepID=UPI002982D4B3|nr:helix-turn-helix domain-containing protein [Enterococcus faecalis]EKB7628482.1 helix-turn-helix domain-containing protein [Enterococcus faecalis]